MYYCKLCIRNCRKGGRNLLMKQWSSVLEQIKNKLIVSCQARVGWPMYGADIMAAFAAAAQQGGAAGIRATGADNIRKIKEIKPQLNGRFEAVLDNGERQVVNRHYVSGLKEKFVLR